MLATIEAAPARGAAAANDRAIQIAHTYFEDFLRGRSRAEGLNRWTKGGMDGEGIFAPRGYRRSEEHKALGDVARSPYLRLVHRATVQQLVVDGIRSGDEPQTWTSKDSSLRPYFQLWQDNRFDHQSVVVHDAATAHGTSYVVAGFETKPLSGRRFLQWTPIDQTQGAGFYRQPGDEFPEIFLLASRKPVEENGVDGWRVVLIDSTHSQVLDVKGDGWSMKDWSVVGGRVPHGANVPPVVRYLCNPDSTGRADGEVEPYIPMAERIDQTTFDRLIVQRWGAWKIRYVTGMAVPGSAEEKAKQDELIKGLMDSRQLLVGYGPAEFGTMDATQIEGFIAAGMSDLRDLAATSQTPPYHLLGMSDNLQAESLAAAASAQRQKVGLIQLSYGESHESLQRLTGHMTGNLELADDYTMQVRWRDMSVRSMTQVADALAKYSDQVGIPQEMVFEMVDGWTDVDVQRALSLVDSKKVDDMIAQLSAAAVSQPAATTPAADTAAAATPAAATAP